MHGTSQAKLLLCREANPQSPVKREGHAKHVKHVQHVKHVHHLGETLGHKAGEAI